MINNPDFTIIEDSDGYSIFWCIFNKESEIGRKYNVWGDISLPYFMVGKDLIKFNETGEAELTEINLLMGIILRYSATPPLTVTHKVKPYFKDILRDLLSQYHMI